VAESVKNVPETDQTGIGATPVEGNIGKGVDGSGERAVDTCDTGYFEKLCQTIRALMQTPLTRPFSPSEEEYTRKEPLKPSEEEEIRKGNHTLLCTIMRDRHAYIKRLSENSANSVWSDIGARIEQKDKTPERQEFLSVQDKNDRREWTQVRSGRNCGDSQTVNRNRQDAISRVSAVQESARGPRCEH